MSYEDFFLGWLAGVLSCLVAGYLIYNWVNEPKPQPVPVLVQKPVTGEVKMSGQHIDILV